MQIRTAAYHTVVLFQEYPKLRHHFPMFYDMIPIIWYQDPLYLITRKTARYFASKRLILERMEQIAKVLEMHYPASKLLIFLYRYIVDGYIYPGYWVGLRDLKLARAQE